MALITSTWAKSLADFVYSSVVLVLGPFLNLLFLNSVLICVYEPAVTICYFLPSVFRFEVDPANCSLFWLPPATLPPVAVSGSIPSDPTPPTND